MEILGAEVSAAWIRALAQNQPVDVVIRPEDVDLVKPEEGII